MEVHERKVVKKRSKSKSSKRHPSSSSDPIETKTNSKPHANPTSPNPNGDPSPAPAARKNQNPNPIPNPNPKSSKPPKPSPSSPNLPKSPTKSSKPPKPDFVMPDDPSSEPASPSRKSDRKRKARDFSDEEPFGKSSQAGQRRLADDNAVALLRAAVDFRSGTGSIPLPSNMGIFHEFVKASLPTPLSKEQVYNKLRHLRRKFQKSGPPGSGPNDDLVRELCTALWGALDKKDCNKEENKAKEGAPVAVIKNGDAATVAAKEEQQGDGEEQGVHGLDSFPYVSSAAAEHWRANGLWGVSWEAGLRRMDPSKVRVLEEKWRRQLGDEMKLQMDWSKTSRELLALLNDAYKGMST